MSTITGYLKMNNAQLSEEITKQKKKIAAAQETISLLKKLQIAADTISRSRQAQEQRSGNMTDTGSAGSGTMGNT